MREDINKLSDKPSILERITLCTMGPLVISAVLAMSGCGNASKNEGNYGSEPKGDGYWMQGFELKGRSDGARERFGQTMDALRRRY